MHPIRAFPNDPDRWCMWYWCGTRFGAGNLGWPMPVMLQPSPLSGQSEQLEPWSPVLAGDWAWELLGLNFSTCTYSRWRWAAQTCAAWANTSHWTSLGTLLGCLAAGFIMQTNPSLDVQVCVFNGPKYFFCGMGFTVTFVALHVFCLHVLYILQQPFWLRE